MTTGFRGIHMKRGFRRIWDKLRAPPVLSDEEREAMGQKKITVHSSSGEMTSYWQLPEDNPVCRRMGHLHSRPSRPGNPHTGYDVSTHCFRCGFSNWTDPWT